MIVGRSADCDVVVNHPYVSGRHLRIMAGIVVQDLGSSNGTFLDDRRLESPEIVGIQQLTVGGPVIRIEVTPEEDVPDTTGLSEEVGRLRARVTELEAKLAAASDSFRVSPAGSHGVQESSGETPTATPLPDRERESALLLELAQKDIGEFNSRLDGSVTDFYILESFRFLRHVEKVVTRMAGEFTTQLGMNTMLPDQQGNFMALFAEVLLHPDDPVPKDELLEYLGQLRKWLFVSLGAYQRASKKFTEELRRSLSPLALTQSEAIPALHRYLGSEEKILWRRTRAFLNGLSESYIKERLDQLARDSAQELIGGNPRQ